MSWTSVYIAEVKKAGTPIVAYAGTMLEALASFSTVEGLLLQSITPINVPTGKVPTKDADITHIAAFHVLARATTYGNAGEATMRAMHTAGFKGAGYASKQTSTPASRRIAAQALIDNAIAKGLLKPASKVASKPATARKPKPATPAVQPVEVEAPIEA